MIILNPSIPLIPYELVLLLKLLDLEQPDRAKRKDGINLPSSD